MCYAAIGTDTAGSIREPAALCGVVGLKPSYALVSARGVIPLSVSLDHVGPITRTVEDAAIVLDAIAERPGDYVASSGRPLGRKVLGIPRNHFYENLDSSVGACAERAITEFQNLGFELREINVPVDTDRTLQIAEAYAFHRERLAESQELYDPETLRRIRAGENISQDAYRDSAERLQKTRGEISHIFHRIDALITPTTPIPAPGIGDLTEDPTHLRPIELVLLRNTRPVNIWGLPAISVPCGFTTKGLPIGLQIIGRPQGESEVIGISQAYERQKCFGC
jgi:Asp-tRNA(Asn)/Glu-tRNA(Gln) amidotransferase A subunit family amidase